MSKVEALREFFKTNLGNYVSEFSSQESKQKDMLHQSQTSTGVVAQSNENKDSKVDVESEVSKGTSVRIGFVEMDDESDEFFDPPEYFLEDFHSDIYSQNMCPDKPCTPTAYDLEKKLHEYTDLEETVWGEGILRDFIFTLPKDQTGSLSNSWSVPEPLLFQIRGETYFEDHKKISAQSTLMQTVAVDWLRSDRREDNLAARPGNIVQKFAANGRPEFFFVVNFQVPGSTTYTIASYYMTRTPIKDLPLLKKFVEGDDAFRNSRFKLIPHVTEGPWVLKKSVHRATLVGQLLKINYIRGKNYIELDIDVGSSALARGIASTALTCFNNIISETAFVIQGPWVLKKSVNKAILVGQLLKINYIRGKNYIELDIDVRSSALARGIASTALSCFNNIISETAFVIQANKQDELPEHLYGATRLNYLDVSKAFQANP
ncbi:hypothetical protein CTI12_AA034290 [Artemisia annua]|uniref:Protein ENHANCED DISEASE RESISTANCE 2 C-terminal domain-containing protein n=1 Tax=Artemisia annua TaxID=35608 RepID=A0A2U1QG39_ARTAN|nr:hypothetical protein CTI12_AA034290 [Artemisia annua]